MMCRSLKVGKFVSQGSDVQEKWMFKRLVVQNVVSKGCVYKRMYIQGGWLHWRTDALQSGHVRGG